MLNICIRNYFRGRINVEHHLHGTALADADPNLLETALTKVSKKKKIFDNQILYLN